MSSPHPPRPVRSRTYRDGPRRRSLRGLALGLLAAVVLGLVGAGAGALRARDVTRQVTDELQAGAAALDTGKQDLVGALAAGNPALLTSARTHFEEARSQFSAGGSRVAADRFLGAAAMTPLLSAYAAPRTVAAEHLALMGAALAEAGLGLSAVEARLIAPGGRLGGNQGSFLSAIRASKNDLEAVRGDLDRAGRNASVVDSAALPAPERVTLARTQRTITGAVAALKELPDLLSFLDSVLGLEGPRTYLIEQVNPGELRPGGGFIGTYSVIVADHGLVTLEESGDAMRWDENGSQPGDPGYAAPPEPMSRFLGMSGWSWFDSNFSPDFPSNARAGERLIAPHLRTRLDGVISMDYYVVAALLKITGPVSVPGYGLTVGGDDLVPQIVKLDLDTDPSHKAVLAAVASVMLPRLASLSSPRLLHLGTVLAQLAAGRHLQAYFNAAEAEREVGRLGLSGTLNPTGASDTMMEVEANVGASKANYFTQRRYDVTLTRQGDVLHHRVEVTVTDPVARPLAAGYTCYVRLYVPAAATRAAVTGVQPIESGERPPAGYRVLDGAFQIIAGSGSQATRHVIFTYDTPAGQGGGDPVIYWQKQPGTPADQFHVTWRLAGRTYRADGTLDGDRVLHFSDRRVWASPASAAQGGSGLPGLAI